MKVYDVQVMVPIIINVKADNAGTAGIVVEGGISLWLDAIERAIREVSEMTLGGAYPSRLGDVCTIERAQVVSE